jgi:uncharacterized phiE125 gp8 family phage protein
LRISETIPTVLTWAEIKAHCRLDDDGEKDYLTGLGIACVEAFERATGRATGTRTVTVVYSFEDVMDNVTTVALPKGPLVSITSIVDHNNRTSVATDYEIRQKGHVPYLHFWTVPSTPFTITYVAGSATVPQLAKVALLLHVEHLYRNRGATSSQQQYAVDMGLQRIQDLYDTAKALAG